MAHKTITISEEAYKALDRIKKEKESFTDVILRIAGIKTKKKQLVAWLESSKTNEDLAQAIENVYNNRKNWTFRPLE
ncbi:MAG: antitoxin VapB family protein [Candidatus Hodarchaeales archaeon]|jgi:predicted CopG family antitoxin